MLLGGDAAAWPAEGLARGEEVAVLLELIVDAEGRVVDAAVAEPMPVDDQGLGFEDAALAAAATFRFSPALDGSGQPVPARIQYRVRFTLETAVLPPVQPEEPEEPPPAEPAPLPDDADEAGEVVEIVGERVAPPQTERVLNVAQIQLLPGSGGDVVKAVQNLPGVNRAPFGGGQILIRGTAPEDSAFYLDGVPLPLVFHFGGLNTVVNGDSLEEVAFLPGGYGVRYGRSLAGLIDLRTSPSLPEDSSGYLSIDLFQATLFAEQRISGKTAVSLSGRRSYIDAILGPVLNATSESTIQAPRYYDLNARLLHRPDNGDVLDAFLVLSDDAFRIIQPDSDEVAVGLQTRFAKLRLLYRHIDAAGWRHETAVMVGPEEQAFQLAPDGEAFERPLDFSLRQEMYLSAPESSAWEDRGVGWRAGLDLFASRYRFVYDVPAFGVREEGDIGILAPAAYVEATARLGRLDVVPGLRGDLYTTDAGYTGWTADPRLGLGYRAWQKTRFKASVGRHSQWPDPREVTPRADGDLDLTAEWALQTTIGVEQRVGQHWRFELQRYYNWLNDLVVGNEDAFRFFTGPPASGPVDTDPYANDGIGRTAGVEFLAELQADRTVGLLAATVSRSVRQDRPDEAERLFEFDQPVVINALLSQELPKLWRIGARFRFGSGNPYTPVVNRWYDQDAGWQPVYADTQERTTDFWQLDLRVDKTWEFRRWALSWYLDLQNATNRQNAELISYSDDYTEEAPVMGLPVIPAFGLKGAW